MSVVQTSLRDSLAETMAHLANPPPASDAVALRVWHARRAEQLHSLADRQPRHLLERLELATFALRLLLAGAELDAAAARVAAAAVAGLEAEIDRLDQAGQP